MSDVGRNDPCPCGSGKKYKQCCIDKANNTDKLQSKDQVTALMATCMVASMEILRDEFGFSQEQLSKFTDRYPEVLKKNLNQGS